MNLLLMSVRIYYIFGVSYILSGIFPRGENLQLSFLHDIVITYLGRNNRETSVQVRTSFKYDLYARCLNSFSTRGVFTSQGKFYQCNKLYIYLIATHV